MAAVPPLGLDGWMLALYNGDTRLLWHQRLLLGTMVLASFDPQAVKARTGWDVWRTFLIATPDHDVYAEEYSADNPDLAAFKLCNVRLPPPPGVASRSWYRFAGDPTAARRLEYLAAARVAADELFTVWNKAMIAAGRPAVPLPAGGAFVPLCNVTDLLARLDRAPLAQVPAAMVFPGPGVPMILPPSLGGLVPAAVPAVVAKWVVMESTTSASRGDTYLLLGTESVRGRRGIGTVNGIDCAIFNLQGDDLEKFKGAEAFGDARLLGLDVVAGVRDKLQWRDVAAKVSEVTFNDWPIPGPRTAKWCVDFINRRGGGAIDYHLFWMNSNGLYPAMWGVQEHEAALEILDLAGTYDGLDIPNSAGLEHLVRRAQMIEFSYSDHGPAPSTGTKSGKGGKQGSSGALDEVNIFTGQHRSQGDVMICPELIDYVSKETEREASFMKQVRKAREERELAARSNKRQKGEK